MLYLPCLVPLLAIAADEPVRQVHTVRREVALTFDACQDKHPAGYDTKLIAVLKRERVKATLFLGGAWARAHAKEAAALVRDPLFEIAQHSNLHPHFPKLGGTQIANDLAAAQDAIRQTTGKTPTLFRPPYGEWNPATLQAARKLGLTTVLWSVETGDPDKNISAKAIVQTVLSRAKPGAIVIMHMNGRGWHTAEALPALIAGLRKKGYSLVTVSDLMRRSDSPATKAGR
ncbi:MAG: polysaccharide deacetylase family protein [Armatimonadetes bacterium]|nr:polysaccharide deacetylase family protein [Armatimonadota bacterium]